MQNYRILKVDCCSNCRWAKWDWDGVIECLQSKIIEVVEQNTTYLKLETVPSLLGVCDLHERKN